MDRRLFWLALGTFAIGTEGFVVSSLLPAISADTGVTLAEGGYLVLAFAIAYAIGAPVLTSFTGHRDRRIVLTASMGVFALGNVIAGLSYSYEQLLIARVVMALAAGLYVATAQATAIAISEPHHRARAIAVIVGGTTVAVAFGAPIGALIGGIAGWRGTFWSIAALGVASMAAIYALVPNGLSGPRLPLSERLAVIGRPGIVPLLLTTVLPLTGAFAVFTYIAPVATRVFSLDASFLPEVLLAFGVGGAIGNYIGGQLADRLGATQTVLASTLLMTIVLLGMGSVAHVPQAVEGPAFLTFVFVWGLVGWALPPAQASRIVRLAADAAPLALSLNSSAIYVGVALGSVVGGLVLTYAVPAEMGYIAAAFPALAFALTALYRPAPSLSEARLG